MIHAALRVSLGAPIFRSGVTFTFRGRVADIDETTDDYPGHPATLLLVEIGDKIDRVVVPDTVLGNKLPLLCPERPIVLYGEVRQLPDGTYYVAKGLRVLPGQH